TASIMNTATIVALIGLGIFLTGLPIAKMDNIAGRPLPLRFRDRLPHLGNGRLLADFDARCDFLDGVVRGRGRGEHIEDGRTQSFPIWERFTVAKPPMDIEEPVCRRA